MISIVVTFHNEEHSIISCLQSIVAQSAQQWECVIVDNGSSDQGEFQVRNYLIDRRMRFFHLAEHISTAEARAYGLQRTTGEWVMYVDGGDYLESNALQALYLTLKHYGTLCAVGNYYDMSGGKKRPASYDHDGLIRGGHVSGGHIEVRTGNSIFSRQVAHLPESWPTLDFGYTEHLILVSGEVEEPLVRVDRRPWWKRIFSIGN